MAQLEEEGEFAEQLFVHGLGVQTAEGLAEWLHWRVRNDLGIDVRQGRRYSWGYPAVPDQSEHLKVERLLNISQIGMEISDGYAPIPEQSTLALICHHPQAGYYGMRNGRLLPDGSPDDVIRGTAARPLALRRPGSVRGAGRRRQLMRAAALLVAGALALAGCGRRRGLALAGCEPSDRERCRSRSRRSSTPTPTATPRPPARGWCPRSARRSTGGCEAGLKKESDALSKAEKDRLHSLGVRDVRIKGDRADVWLEAQGGEPGHRAPRRRRVAGREPLEERADLVREQAPAPRRRRSGRRAACR